jgi:hypothetical protein
MNVHIDQREISKRLIPHPLPVSVQQLAPPPLLLHRHPKIDRAEDHAGRIALQFDIAEFACGAFLDAGAQARLNCCSRRACSSALSSTRPGTVVPEAIRHSQAAIIRPLRFLTIIAAGSCRQAQPPGPFGR